MRCYSFIYMLCILQLLSWNQLFSVYFSHSRITRFSSEKFAFLVSTDNLVLNGLYSINGITPGSNSRILLTGQTNPVENGLWLVQSGNWIRPDDFSSGSTAGQVCIKILLQTTSTVNTQWICTTPSAIIDTDPLFFDNCCSSSSSSQTNAANVGSGAGQLFRDKTDDTLNFKTIAAIAHLLVTNNSDDITLATDATSNAVGNTLVARNNDGDFSANIINAALNGAASQNVLKSGDIMSGTLTLPAGTTAAPALQFSGSTNSGLSAASANTVSFSTNGVERMAVSPTGIVSIKNLTSAGIVHNDSSGAISSALIINGDIHNAAGITDTKLATISTAGKVANSATSATSANSANTIVARDSFGNFSAGTVSANVTGAASQNVLKAGDTMSGTLTLPAGTTAVPSVQFSGSTNTGLSAAAANTVSISTNGIERMKINSATISHSLPFVHNNVVCDQAVQSVVPISNGSVTVTSGISLLLLNHSGSVTNFTINFPPNPLNGQLFTILVATTNSITINNSGGTGGAAVVNPVIKLNPAAATTATSNGSAVTYFYASSINSWCRLWRG